MFLWFEPQVRLSQDLDCLRPCQLVVETFLCMCHHIIEVHNSFLPYSAQHYVMDKYWKYPGASVGLNGIFRGANWPAWHKNASFSLLYLETIIFPYVLKISSFVYVSVSSRLSTNSIVSGSGYLFFTVIAPSFC